MVTTKDTNPKDAIGATKVPLSLLSPVAKALWALAHFSGLVKYGAWNWRVAGVRASIYLDAIDRHRDAYLSGEELDPVDGTPHLANIMACAAILLDAKAAGKLVDDRPPSGNIRPMYAFVEDAMKTLREKYADKSPRHYTIADTQPTVTITMVEPKPIPVEMAVVTGTEEAPIALRVGDVVHVTAPRFQMDEQGVVTDTGIDGEFIRVKSPSRPSGADWYRGTLTLLRRPVFVGDALRIRGREPRRTVDSIQGAWIYFDDGGKVQTPSCLDEDNIVYTTHYDGTPIEPPVAASEEDKDYDDRDENDTPASGAW